jgi:transposase
MACDTLGRPVRFLLAPGNSHDILAVPALLEGHRPQAVLADRAYDANSLRQRLDQIGAEAVIPSTRSRRAPIPHDTIVYKLRNRIERCFNKLKHFRRFATRYDRLAAHYLAFIHLAASMIWMR